MPREPRAAKLVVHAMHPEPVPADVGDVLIDRDTALPVRFSVTFELEQPPLLVRLTVVTVSSRPEVAQMDIRAGWRNSETDRPVFPDGGITSTVLRQVLIDQLVRMAVAKFTKPAVRVPQAQAYPALLRAGLPERSALVLSGDVFTVPGRTPLGEVAGIAGGRLGRATTETKIAMAADEYRRAVAAGSKAPVKEVGIALGYSASQASRYVAAARKRGLLGDEGASPEAAE